MSDKELKMKLVADTSSADKKVDKWKKSVENQDVNLSVDVDLSSLKNALGKIESLTKQIAGAFDKDFKFSGLKKGLDDANKTIDSLIKKTKDGTTHIDVNPIGIDELKKNITVITDNIKSLNESKITLDSFEKLASVLENIETLLNSIVKGMNFDAIRPSNQIQEDIDSTIEKLEKLAKTEEKINKLEKSLSGVGVKKARKIIDWGDSEDVAALEKFIKEMKEYVSLGGDLSKIKFKAFNVETGTKELYSLIDALEILEDEGKVDLFDENAISNDVIAIKTLRNELSELNKELVSAKNRENRDLKVSLDTKSIEDFSETITEAFKNIENLNINIPENLSFDGLSPENFDKIIGKFDEIISKVKGIGDVLSTGIDTSKLGNIEVDVTPKVDASEFIKKIEEKLEGSVVEVKTKITEIEEGTKSEEPILIDNSVISQIKDKLKEVSNDFGYDLSQSLDIREGLENSLKNIDFEKSLSSLRETLSEIVKQFQNSLESVNFSSSQLDELYKTIKGWSDADSYAAKKANVIGGERGAFLNLKTGAISNSFFTDGDGSFSDTMFQALKDLSVGVNNEIGSIYDTWVHSHPFRTSINGLKAIGGDTGFSLADLDLGIDKALKENIPNMLSTNNYKYSNLDLSGIAEGDANRLLEEYRKELLNAGLKEDNNGKIFFPTSLAKEGSNFNFDKKTEILNGAMLKALSNVGLEISRLTSGNVEDLKVDMSALHQEEQKASEEAQELLEVFRQLSTALDSFNGESFKFGISEESLDGIIKKLNEIVEAIKQINVTPTNTTSLPTQHLDAAIEKQQELQSELKETIALEDDYKSLLNKDFSTKNKTEATKQLKQAYEAYKPFYEDYEKIGDVTEAGTRAGYVYLKAFEEAVKQGIAKSNINKYSVSTNRHGDSQFYNKYDKITNEDFDEALATYTARMQMMSEITDEIRSKFGNIDYNANIFDGIEANAYSVMDAITEYIRAKEHLDSMKLDDSGLFDNEDIELQMKYIDRLKDQIVEYAEIAPKLNIQPDTYAQEQYEREAKAIEEVIAAEQKLDSEQKDHVDNSQEVTSMQNLADRVDTVTTAVDLKSRAFQEEEQIVIGTVQREISSLELLDGQLTEIVNTLDKIKTESTGLDFNSLTNVNADNGLNKLLSDLNEQVKGLDIESLSKLSGAIQGLKTTITTAENLEMVAVALKELKESLSGINANDNSFLSSINSILSKKDELQNLCKILESSAENIKKVGDTVTGADSKTGKSSNVGGSDDVLESIRKKKEELAACELQAKELKHALDKLSDTDKNQMIGVNRHLSDKQAEAVRETITSRVFKEYDPSSSQAGLGKWYGTGKLDSIDKAALTTYQNWNEELQKVGYRLGEIRETTIGLEADIIPIDGKAVTNAEEFRAVLSSIKTVADQINSDISKLEAKSSTLRNEISTLETSPGRDSGLGKDIQEDAEKASKSVRELKDDIESLYGSLRKSIKDRGSKNIFGTEHFIDDLMEVSKKYKSIQELRASNKSLISDQDMQSIEEYFAKFKMSAGDFVGNIDQTNKTPEFISQLKQAEAQLKSVEAVLDKVKSGEAFTEEDIAKVKEFISQIRNLNSVERDRSNNFADTTKVDKLLGNIADDLRKHSSMTKELREEYELLQNEIKSFGNNLPTDKLKEFESTYANLNRRMKEGQTGLSFFDGIIKKARTMSQNFIAMYFSLYDIIRYIRTGVTYIKDLDTAFTEMRKVSDESTKSLKNFQNESFDIANAVGTTAKQIQNSTADWMGEILVPLYGNI